MTDAHIIPQALTIATSDSGGGAGIQGDIKAMEANGVFALSVLVAVTAQNTRSITLIHPLPYDVIEAQIDAVFDDFDVGAAKTGCCIRPRSSARWRTVGSGRRAPRRRSVGVERRAASEG
jgi:hydroxymethylpyrimidine/phosphomethylpyrimidine kinase